MIHLDIHEDVPRHIAAWMRRMTDVLPEITEIRHSVRVHVLPSAYWLDSRNFCWFGTFYPPRKRSKEHALIHVAGRSICSMRRLGIEAERQWVSMTLLHEIAHYEQWRDGRKLVEQGAENRARGLWAACIEALDAE